MESSENGNNRRSIPASRPEKAQTYGGTHPFIFKHRAAPQLIVFTIIVFVYVQMRHILAGTTEDDLINRISNSDSKFSGLLPTANALHKHRSGGRAAVVTPQTLFDLVNDLGKDTVVHFQTCPSFLLVIQTTAMVSARHLSTLY